MNLSLTAAVLFSWNAFKDSDNTYGKYKLVYFHLLGIDLLLLLLPFVMNSLNFSLLNICMLHILNDHLLFWKLSSQCSSPLHWQDKLLFN